MSLLDWVDEKQKQGCLYFDKVDALADLEIENLAFNTAAHRLVKKKRIERIFSGFYIILPLEQQDKGLPALYYIEPLMKYRDTSYYVGLLSAASLHGASHHAVQELQVIAENHFPKLKPRGNRIQFIQKQKLGKSKLETKKVPTGYFKISSLETTIFDLVAYHKYCGGWDNVVTVISELADQVDPKMLLVAAKKVSELVVVQRVGAILEILGHKKQLIELKNWILKQNTQYKKLIYNGADQEFERYQDWKIIVNEELEVET